MALPNPPLQYTIIYNPKNNSDTVQVNKVLSTNIINSDWNSLTKSIFSSMKMIKNKGESDILIPVSWNVNDFDAVKDFNGDFILDENNNKIIRRCSYNVKDWYLLPLDIDDLLTMEKAKEQFKEYEYIAYTTFNHTKENNKFRMFFPLLSPISNNEFKLRKSEIIKFMGVADKASIVPSQGFYLPSYHIGNETESLVWSNKGKFLDIFDFQPAIETNNNSSIINLTKPADWYPKQEVDLSKYPNATKFLHKYIEDNFMHSAHHDDCLKMHSILKSFSTPVEAHRNILLSFMCPTSSHKVDIHIASSNSSYGGIGSMINLFKKLNTKNTFDLNTFKKLCGLHNRKDINSTLGSKPAKTIRSITLSDNSFPTEKIEGSLIFSDNSKKDKVSGHLSDSDFPYGITILDSPTNSGKTYLFTHILKNKRIIIAPTKVLVDQVCSASNGRVQRCYGNDKFPIGANAIAMTYDKITLLSELIRSGSVKKQEYSLFIDEAHNLYSSYSYRSETMDSVYQSIKDLSFDKVILMSGTIREEFLPNLSIELKIIAERNQPSKQKCIVVDTNNSALYVNNALIKNKLNLVLLNNKSKGEALGDFFQEQGFKCQLFNADTQHSDENQEMIKNECVANDVDVLIITSIGIEGLNINNKKIGNVFSIGHQPSAILEQLKNRIRRFNPDLYIIRSSLYKGGYIRTIDVNKKVQAANKFIDSCNEMIALERTDNRMKALSYFHTSAKSMPSDIRFMVGINRQDLKLYQSDLGLAAFLYEVDCTNESHNLVFFEQHMKNYGFDVIYKSEKYSKNSSNGITFSPVRAVLKNVQRNAKQSYILSELFRNHAESIDALNNAYTYINENNDPYDLSSSKTKEELKIINDSKDTIIKLKCLTNYYTLEGSKYILHRNIKYTKTYKKALEYANQILSGSWARQQLEKKLQLYCWYTIEQMKDIFTSIEADALREMKTDFHGYKNPNAMSKYLGSMFQIDRKRYCQDSRRLMKYLVVSFNPIGAEVWVNGNVVEETKLDEGYSEYFACDDYEYEQLTDIEMPKSKDQINLIV